MTIPPTTGPTGSTDEAAAVSAKRLAEAAKQYVLAQRVAAGPEPYIFWQDDWVTLWCGRMEDVLPRLGGQQFDACVTDPPYGETSLAWDRWPAGWPALVARHTRSLWSWGSMRMFLRHHGDLETAGWRLAQDFVWEKTNGSGAAIDRFRRVHEIATHWYHGPWGDVHHDVPRVPARFDRHGRVGEVILKGSNRMPHRGDYEVTTWTDDGLRLHRSVILAQNMRGKAIHPTEKPVDVLSPLIEYSVPEGGTVLEPFAGSCSTGVAARALGRRSVLIEADKAMCAKAVEKRLSNYDLFTGSAS